MKILLLICMFFFSVVTDNNSKSDGIAPTSTDIIYKSDDGGQTWHDVSDGLPAGLQPYCVYMDGEAVLLGYEKGLYKSNGNTKSLKWEKDIFLPESVTDFHQGKAGLYSLINGKGLFQKMAVTGVWRPVFSNLKNEFPRVVLENADGSILVGAEKGIFKSFDGGMSWKKVLADNMVTSLVAKDGIIVGGSSSGILRSEDYGEHWEFVHNTEGFARVTGLIEGQFVAITSGEDSSKPLMLKPAGMVNKMRTSKDGGKTWQNTDKRILPHEYISDIHQHGQYLFSSNEKGIFRSSDKGKTWILTLPAKKDNMLNLTISGNVIYAIKAFNGC